MDKDTEFIREKYSRRCVVKVTPSQYETLLRLAAQARLEPTVYMRMSALGFKPARQRKAITVDARLFAIFQGALGTAVPLLRDMINLLEHGDVPFDDNFRMVLSKLEMAADAALQIAEQN